jgi:2'-5' RNA ligase
MSQKIRVFIAIELPDSLKSQLEQVQQELKSLRLKARWVRVENIHLTLKFLGDIDAGDIDDIGGAMAGAAADSAPLALKIGGIGFFPGIKRPRVVWVGLGGEIRNLLNLQLNLADRLAAIGFAKEKRSFKAHLTLGRIRQAANPAAVRRILKGYIELGDHPFVADRMTLFQSTLKPTGAVYSKLKETELRND